jgi:hypothetical protein
VGKTLADGYLEIRPDTSKLGPKFQSDIEKITAEAAKRSSERFSRDFDTKVNAKLRGLDMAPIDITANPADALAAIDSTERELRDLARSAPTLDVRVRTQDAINELGRMRRRIGDVGDELGAQLGEGVAEGFVREAPSIGAKINASLKALNLDEIDVQADPRDALAAIDTTRRNLNELSREAATVEIRVNAEEALSELGKLRKRIGDTGANDGVWSRIGARIGVSTANGMFASLSAGLKAPPPQVYAGAALLAAAVAPTLGAGIAGAVVGGIGVGGVVGGMVIAARDPRVKAAGGELGRFMLADLEQRADGFVAPMVHGIRDVRAAWVAMGPDLDRIFESSRFVDPLVDGVLHGIRRVVAGAADAVGAAGPVIASFGSSVSRIGDAVGDSFSLLARDAEAGASAIDDLTTAAVSFIETTTAIVHGLATVKGWFDSLDKGIDRARYQLEAWGWQIDLTADGFKAGSAEAEAYERVTLGTATAADIALLKQAELKKGLDGTAATAAHGATNLNGLANAEGLVKTNSERLKTAQTALKDILGAVSAETSVAKQRGDALRQVYEGLYSATMRNADANQTYQESWDQLSGSVKANKRTLDIHTAAGRSNRSALIGLLKSNNDLYFANIEAGESTASATKKHQARTEAIRKESVRLTGNTGATNTLIKTYGRIPPKKTTDLVLRSVDNVADALLDLAAVQLHLAKGTPLSASLKRRLARAQYGMPDTKRGFGGPLPGHAPHDRADNMVYSGTPGEWVIQRPTVRKVERQHGSGAMNYFNKYGELPLEGHAFGGLLRASRASWGGPGMNYRVTAGMTKVPTMERVIAAVPVMMGGNWPSSPSAQRGDSGVWRSIVRMIRATGPMSGHFGNAYRPGDPKWHGSGRAVDWMGFNQDRLASFLAARNPLELIHRTRNRDYAYTRGRNKGSFNNALMQAHRNHIHIAMKEGGDIDEPVYGVGRSGRTYEFGEQGREHVVPGTDMDAAVTTLQAILNRLGNTGPTRMHLDDIRALARAIGEAVGARIPSAGRVDAAVGAMAGLYARSPY